MRILVVEDEQDLNRILTKTLTAEGYSVDACFDGVEALRALVCEDLSRACLLGLEMSVEDLNRRGNPVHKNTREALDFLRKEIDNGC